MVATSEWVGGWMKDGRERGKGAIKYYFLL